MQENFLVSVPSFKLSRNTYLLLIALIIAVIIIVPVIGWKNEIAIFIAFILAVIIYILLINMNNNNLVNSLPKTAYPVPPHLGLNGISIDNLVAGVQTVN
jgi:uncharacterized membrane protein